MGIITSKYDSKCRTCGGFIAAGSSVNWTKGEGVTHAKACPAKAPSAPKAASAPVAAATPAPVSWSYDAGRARPQKDGRVGEVLRAPKRAGAHAGKVVVVVRQRCEWIREDGLSFGMQDDEGWCVTLWAREATPAEVAELESDEATKKAADERRAADKAEKERAEAERIAMAKALYVGLENTGDSWSQKVIAKREAVASWKDGYWNARLERVELVNGETGFVLHADGYDDFRSTLYASRASVELAWRRCAEEMGTTPEQAADWLAKCRGCAGTPYFEFIAGDLPPATAKAS